MSVHSDRSPCTRNDYTNRLSATTTVNSNCVVRLFFPSRNILVGPVFNFFPKKRLWDKRKLHGGMIPIGRSIFALAVNFRFTRAWVLTAATKVQPALQGLLELNRTDHNDGGGQGNASLNHP
jgi:hypothetical protein